MRLPFKSKWAHRVQAALPAHPQEPHAPPDAPTLPDTSDAGWDEAFARVESYLRAHHIESRMQLNRSTNEIIRAARALALRYPTEMPVTLALRVTQARMGEWFVQALGEGDWADERFRARGRLAFLMADIPHECPEWFLSGFKPPSAMQARLAGARLQPGPELRIASMPASPLAFPLDDAIQKQWSTFNRSAFARSSLSWFVISGLVSLAWLITR